MTERRALSSLASAWVATLSAACVWACGTTDVPVFELTQGADGGTADGAVGEGAPGTRQAICDASGPPVLVDSMGDGGPIATCPDRLARPAFGYALCTCGDCGGTGTLLTDAFDGSRGAYDASSATEGGSVGVDGDLHPGPLHVGGSLWASNSAVVTTSAVYVGGDLHAQGELRPSTDASVQADALTVKADAWMAGGLQTTGSVTVGGAVHVPSAQTLDVTGTFVHGMLDRASSFSVTPPCDCAADHLVDVPGIIAAYETANDDAVFVPPIKAGQLEDVATDTTLPLECGRIFFTHIGASQAMVHLTVNGHVALFVKDYILASNFVVDVPSGSEFDMFVGGNVTVSGAFQVGSATNPGRVRMYVGGTTLNLNGVTTLVGSLYAPRATLTLGASAPATVYGALFASTIAASADLTIHYDQSNLSTTSGTACSVP